MGVGAPKFCAGARTSTPGWPIAFYIRQGKPGRITWSADATVRHLIHAGTRPRDISQRDFSRRYKVLMVCQSKGSPDTRWTGLHASTTAWQHKAFEAGRRCVFRAEGLHEQPHPSHRRPRCFKRKLLWRPTARAIPRSPDTGTTTAAPGQSVAQTGRGGAGQVDGVVSNTRRPSTFQKRMCPPGSPAAKAAGVAGQRIHRTRFG